MKSWKLIFVSIVSSIIVTGCFKPPEPRIVELAEPIQAVGICSATGAATVYRDLPKIFKEFMEIYDRAGIPNRKEPWEYVSLSDYFDETGQTWNYYTGYVVSSDGGIPGEMILFAVPEGTYAVFPLRCKNGADLGRTMGSLKRYIYRKWLPASGYDFTGYEFEYNNEAMREAGHFDIDLYVGIREK